MNERRKARLRKFAIVFCITLGCIFIVALTVRRHSTGTVEDYKRQLIAAGEKLTIRELIPARIPPEQNSVQFFREARSLVDAAVIPFETNYALAMRMVAPGKAMVTWAQADVQFDENGRSWEELEVAIQQRSGVLDLLQQIRTRPALDFEVDYEKGHLTLLPHLAPLRGSAQLLCMAAVSDLHRGDTGSAVTNLSTMLAMAKGIETETIAISHLVRMGIIQIAFSASWELLQSPKATDEELALLQQSWASLEFARAAEKAMLMERVFDEQIIQQLRNSGDFETVMGMPPSSTGMSGDWQEDIKSIWSGTKRKLGRTLWRTSWSYTDELRMLQELQVVIEGTRQLQTNRCFKDVLSETDRRFTAFGFDAPPDALDKFLDGLDEDGLRNLLSSSVLARRFLERSLIAASATQMSVTAIALKRYQLRHGTYPSDLNALVPDFLPAVPLDPMDGKPIRFRLNTDGSFVLYCIGKDGKDDGGDTTPEAGTSNSFYAWQRNRDWVWPQPATVEEIKAYQEKRASR